jgi:heterodisulfide reductase subunit A
MMARIHAHPNIELFLNSTVKEVNGSLANFKSVISHNGDERQVAHGTVIVASGAERYVPTECMYGQDGRVVRNYDQQELMSGGKLKTDAVVFIQCVGSRTPERRYCSRTCCQESIKNALRIREQNPASQVYVLYRDIRTYGLREKFYRRAREMGVKFIRYADGQLPEVAPHNGRLQVTTVDQMTHETVRLDADTVVLGAATVPNPGNKELAQLLKVPLSEEGFFLEAHRKLRPVDFATDGIFLCGAAHSPMGLREALAQAAGAAARAATVLSQKTIMLEPTISHVLEDKCDGCAYCVDPCPFHAITLVEYLQNGDTKKRVKVDEAVCKGCGTCQATCPKGGIEVWHFRPDQLIAEIHAALNL